MKIGIVSDTHSFALPASMLKDFAKVDLIIHAGDFCQWEDVEKLKKVKELQAVYGNMDEAAVRRAFPRRQILELEGITIGVFHGEGPRPMVLERVKAEFAGDKVDCVIYGHSHQPLNQTIGDVLFFNPGSPNDMFSAPYCSYGILEIKKEKVAGKIIKVK